ncbi:Lsm12 protein [Saccharomycopsis crataegensis]|uniref:Lsm12 protein n=1 Tax=Saccharomycopsis crataegensis TaxID=43959 RepID=A0AAV5QH65_9ASCO|nr:Lsm12 protein [Saccharomycopsis crataegensis]
MNSVSLETLLGVRIKATTILDTVIQGKVYSVDVDTNTITLIQDKSSENNLSNNTYRVLRASFLKSAEVMTTKNNNKPKGKSLSKPTFKTADPKISHVNLDDIKAKQSQIAKQSEKDRLQSARDKFIDNNLKLISGIHGKEIYRKITKLFPLEEVQVRSDAIAVFGAVTINKPWGIDNVEIIKKAGDLEKDSRADSSIEFVKSIVVDVNAKIIGG